MPPTINHVRSGLPTSPKEEQSPVQNVNSTYSNSVIPKEKKNICTFFREYTSRDQTETSKFPGEGRKNTLKSIPWRQSQSAKSLCRSNVRGIQL